jgi:hypothetical protein
MNSSPVRPCLFAVLAIAAIMSGCTGSSVTGSIVPEIQYPNRTMIRAIVSLPARLRTHVVQVTPEGSCSAWTVQVTASKSLRTSIENGLLGGLQDVKVLDSATRAPVLEKRDLFVSVRLLDESASIIELPANRHEHATSTVAQQRARYTVSFELKFMDSRGSEIYLVKAMGNGLSDYSGGCNNGIADGMKIAIEGAYQKICDFLAHEVYNSPQLARYAQEHGG